ncbi:hypothetical protein [Sorangium sp. So ce513]|uniref:hypothetical protein n=1 Tax=Sorangium sp. So ce513 TaxID=3133315 RepID=UPI003F5DB06A
MMKEHLAIFPLLTASALLSGCAVDGVALAGQSGARDEQVGRAEQRLNQTCAYFESGQWIDFDCFGSGGDWDPPGIPEGEPPGGEEGGFGTGGEEEGVPTSLDAGIVFSSNGPVPGKHCTQIIEPSDIGGGWGDNYICSTDYIGFRWSHDNAIPGMRCYRINEPAEPWTTRWNDNYLCVPNEARLILYWSSGGSFANAAIRSVRFHEPQDPHGWYDNYLGYYRY